MANKLYNFILTDAKLILPSICIDFQVREEDKNHLDRAPFIMITTLTTDP